MTEQALCQKCGAEFTRNTAGWKVKRCENCRGGAGRPKRIPETTEAAMPETIQQAVPVGTMFTADQVQQILAAQAEMMKSAIQELRKPSEEELAKAAAENERRLEKLRRDHKAAQLVEEAKQARLKACADNGHRNGKGRQVISGQITSGNGMYQAMCQICGFLFAPVPPNGDLPGVTIRSGFNFPQNPETAA